MKLSKDINLMPLFMQQLITSRSSLFEFFSKNFTGKKRFFLMQTI